MYEEYITVGGNPITKRKERTLYGIEINKWRTFIDKKFDRYITIYEKHQDAKLFLNLNKAALFFPFYWMLYRKMFKVAIIFIVLCLVLQTAILGITSNYQYHKFLEIKETYSEHFDENGRLDINTFDISNLDDIKLYEKINSEISVCLIKIIIVAIITNVIPPIIIGFMGDWLYQKHIIKHINKSAGGTSKFSVFIGWLAYDLLGPLVVTLSGILVYLITNGLFK